LRADGTVVFFSGVVTGAVAGTAIFNTSNLTWGTGSNLPTINGQNYGLADAPAAWLPSGNILFDASPGVFNPPTHFFEVWHDEHHRSRGGHLERPGWKLPML
jgi:hypothetical protein